MRKTKNKLNHATASDSSSAVAALTFMDHVRELRRRLIWVALWFVVVTGVAFPFYHDIIQILMQPLGHEKLYYLTPIGGVGFAIKVCMYVGMVATFPILIYHLYKFVSPVMKRHSNQRAIFYMVLSTFLAAAGVVFAYIVSLPSALRFLTGFNIGNVSAMITVDAYMSFIIAYVVASALMFQIPLIMVIIDKITPTPPSRWNKYQRHMIVAAFIIAMLISPSPEITTQVMLAIPVIVMYQFGIGLVWLNHRKHRGAGVAVEQQETPEPTVAHGEPTEQQLVGQPALVTTVSRPSVRTVPRRVDGFMRPMSAPVVPARRSSLPRPGDSLLSQRAAAVEPSVATPKTTIDGFFKASST